MRPPQLSNAGEDSSYYYSNRKLGEKNNGRVFTCGETTCLRMLINVFVVVEVRKKLLPIIENDLTIRKLCGVFKSSTFCKSTVLFTDSLQVFKNFFLFLIFQAGGQRLYEPFVFK